MGRELHVEHKNGLIPVRGEVGHDFDRCISGTAHLSWQSGDCPESVER